MKKNEFSSRMKEYELQCTGIKLDITQPIVCRLDGNNFSNFTKDLNKPFDVRFNNLMKLATLFAMKETNANLAYTQSDEITLIWFNDKETQGYHNGKLYKILSKLSSKVSVYFNKMLYAHLPEKVDMNPIFDCRVFNVPTKLEAFNELLWRTIDCKKNSVQNLMYYEFGHNKSLNKSTNEKLEYMLKHNVDWNSCPSEFKYGTYFKKFKTFRKYTIDELDKLPKKHNARENPDLEVERTDYKQIIVNSPIDNIKNKVEFVFENNIEPIW